MRQKRMLAPWAESAERRAIYHVMSRVVDRRFVFGVAEKEQFVRYLRIYEAFCGVKVLTYCVMSNHFHLLVEVPPRCEVVAEMHDDRAFLRRLEAAFSPAYVAEVAGEIQRLREGDYAWESPEQLEEAVMKIKERFTYRFNDLSEFMKVLKGRFTQWFNRQNERKGTLWEDRYKSVIVQSGLACRVMAAYIDLNPVRAGIVKDAKDYRWCGYAEAEAGKVRAAAGISRVMSECEAHYPAVSGDFGQKEHSDLLIYRRLLVADMQPKDVNGRWSEETIRLMKSADLQWRDKLICRVRHFTDGAIIGSRAFVDEAFHGMRDRFGESRRDGARRMRGLPRTLFSLRDLVKDTVETTC